ncbi:MAG: hypothetical protein ACYC0F_05070 [Rhodanobacter sp.]
MFAAIAIIIVAVILAVALAPTTRAQNAGPTKGTVPDVKDGKRIIRIYGTVWIDDPIQLAMLNTSQTPIRK